MIKKTIKLLFKKLQKKTIKHKNSKDKKSKTPKKPYETQKCPISKTINHKNKITFKL